MINLNEDKCTPGKLTPEGKIIATQTLAWNYIWQRAVERVGNDHMARNLAMVELVDAIDQFNKSADRFITAGEFKKFLDDPTENKRFKKLSEESSLNFQCFPAFLASIETNIPLLAVYPSDYFLEGKVVSLEETPTR